MVCHLCLSPHLLPVTPGLGRNPSPPRGCPQRTTAASRQRASGRACQCSQPPLAVPVLPPHQASFLPGTHLITVLDLQFSCLHRHRASSFRNCLFPPPFLPLSLPPHTHKPRVGMTKEPHGMALPWMEKNEEDVHVEAGMKNEK